MTHSTGPQSVPSQPRNCILIVDDDQENLRLLCDTLTEHGYQTQGVPNGPMALDAIAQGQPDLILLDINMRHMDGYELCQRLKADEKTREIPVVFISAMDEVVDKVKAFAVGGVDYITRPFQLEEMLARVETHVTFQGLRRQLQETNYDLEERIKERTAELVQLNRAHERFVPREFLGFLQKKSIVEVEQGDQVQQEMTVMFTDIRNFTPLSEEMTPQQTFNFLNGYLSRVSPIIRQYHGFVDKYIGDAIMSLFARRPDDALKAAIAMLEEIVVYNSHRANCGYRPIGIGIGLHMGTLMLGMIGEAQRLEGTVIADAVNLASRLEGLTKIYDASIVISEQTINSLQDRQAYNYRFLDKVRVKGKRETVSVYEVFDGEAPESKALKLATKPDFEAGLVAYHDQLYAEAKDKFNQVLASNPNDKVAQIYLQRTETALYMNDFAVTVLLVDDQPMVAEAVRRMLANEDDIQFHYCQYPQEAIPQANQLGPTVILQDLVMPDVDGLTLVRFYRANEATRDIPVIVLSTQEGSQTKAEAFAAGVNDYLIKLPDPIELIARIRHHSQGYINLRQRNRVAYLMEQGYLSGVDLAAISSEAPV